MMSRPTPAKPIAIPSALAAALALPVLALPLLALPALAQTKMVEVRDRTPIPGFGINADVADDLDVTDAAGRHIGEVEEVIGPDRNTPEALVIEFEDHIIGNSEEDRVVPLSSVTFDGSAIVLEQTEGLTDLPIWRD